MLKIASIQSDCFFLLLLLSASKTQNDPFQLPHQNTNKQFTNKTEWNEITINKVKECSFVNFANWILWRNSIHFKWLNRVQRLRKTTVFLGNSCKCSYTISARSFDFITFFVVVVVNFHYERRKKKPQFLLWSNTATAI